MNESLQVELIYGSPLHTRIREMIRSRRRASANKMQKYHHKWDEADDAFRAYQPASEADSDRKARRRITGAHDYTTITVPYTFAIIMTAHTYWSTVFLSRMPIYQLQGRHGEAQDSVEAFEAVLDYQRLVGQHMVPWFNWIFDMAKYGLGVTGSYWDRQTVSISRLVEEQATLMGVPLLGKKNKVMQTKEELKYEGNRMFNVRPYDWYPDPRVAIVDFQSGEFCGRDTSAGWFDILDGQHQGRYFNVNELANRLNTGAYDDMKYGGSPRVDLPDGAEGPTEGSTKIPGPGFVHLHEMTVKLNPQSLGLSKSSRTEKWQFTLANDDVIIGAQPQALYHDEFPFDIMEYGFGAHEFLKMNLVEIMAPMVDTISWLVNSHFYNVRKALNDQKVVDPSRIVMKDLTSPLERGIIRLKPTAYGTPVNQAIHQLITPDMTQAHLRDISVMEQLLQRITGVVDELMGLSTGPSRESATGVRTRTGFAANRLKTIAEYNSALGATPLISKFVSNTQQLLQNEQKYRMAGSDGMKFAKRFIDYNPHLIAGQYDFIPVDGTLPIDRVAQANLWKELSIQVATTPAAGAFNLVEMISNVMRLLGEKNIDRFRLDLQTPEGIAQAVQQGNLVPVGGTNGGGSPPGGASGGSSGAVV